MNGILDSLQIVNFQSHSETVIEFDPGVNVIVGSSDSGKSAILRALFWNCFNQPSGTEICRHGTKETSVTAKYSDGVSIQRGRRGGKNFYTLTKGKTEQSFDSFGAAVPDPVRESIDLNEINFQSQLDAPFLLSSNGGEVARKLNEITRLDDIDISTARIAGRYREVKSRLDTTKEDKAKEQERLKTFEPLNKIATIVDEAVEHEHDAATDRESITRLGQYIQRGSANARILQRIKAADLDKAEMLCSEGEGLLRLGEEERESALRLKSLANNLTTLTERINQINSKTLAKASILLSSASDIKKNDTATKLSRLSFLYGRAVEFVTQVNNLTKRLEEAKKKMPKLCPTCGNPRLAD
jgi:hypothetical protein